LAAAQARWERTFAEDLEWQPLAPGSVVSAAGAKVSRREDGSVLVERGGKTDSYTVELPFSGRLTGLRLETLPDDGLPGKGSGHGGGNFVVSRVSATLVPPGKSRPSARFVRISIPGKQKILSLAEVEVLRGGENLARKGTARQSSTDYEGPAKLAIDGNTDGRYHEARSTTHTKISDDPWWEVDLGTEQPLERIVVWNRTDNGLHTRLKDFRIALLDAGRQPLWEEKITEPPNPSARFAPSGERDVRFASAFADYAQKSFDPSGVLDEKDPAKRGWAVGGRTDVPHWLALLPAAPLEAAPGSRLRVRIDQLSKHEFHTVGRFRIAVSEDVRVAEYLRTPGKLHGILRTAAGERPEAERRELTQYYIASVAPELAAERERLAALRKQLAGTKPATSVPIQRELPEGRRRKTLMQRRGNFLETGKEVTRGLPAAFHSPPSGQPVDRLALGKWLVDERNPLTARVVANRLWEQIFGGGIVRTSEEFGSQGERPSHPELLDWLATELVRGGWDIKAALKLLVTSATYRQSSRVTPELWERDPDNRLLARGPRFRLSAEMVRDQALAVSGLLSRKLGGPPVRPPQPTLGVSAAFGGGIDWKTSAGEDRYRRGLYTTWRRSNPYPSMATFDAPNREVCTVRRARTNTPLQALVTLNDPVYVEAAQALARRMARAGATPREKARRGFRLCLARPPSDAELERLVRLFEAAYRRFAADADRARQMATEPLGPLPEGADVSELAAWTVVGNVLLNLDEMLMKR
ncbi:MAG: DUF1553 domain-containing protein, partial [Planctomycetota bacterium]|nr:DUF1553 domain-containing protein [Planctomycetota bacterium]